MGAQRVVVWGNCQAAPVASLLREPLARVGLEVIDLPPVYLLTPAEVQQVHELMADVALLVSQPIRDEYRVPGCSTERLASMLPAGARVVTFPVAYHGGDFPFQVTATDGEGGRPAAPLTDYHDLRVLAAAASSADVDDLDRWWTVSSPAALGRRRASSLAELERREAECDVTVSDLVARPGAMHTLNHPTNDVLAAVAWRVLTAAGRPDLADSIEIPEREFLGAVRTPLETGDRAADTWVVGGRAVGWDEVARAHLAWYAEHPEVVRHTVDRHRAAMADLGLATSAVHLS